MVKAIGIDFGTTNSVVALLHEDGAVTTHQHAAGATHQHAAGATHQHAADATLVDVFRTILCFWTDDVRGRHTLHHAAGPGAINAYLDDPLDSRLIMSMKSFLAQKSFTETRIFGHLFTLERLIGQFLRALLGEITPAHASPPRIIVGRPVRFVGDFANDTLGEARLRGGCADAGLPEVTLALEPEAAGMRFASTLTEPATVLIGDFGGGTSDFSVMRFEPGAARRVTPLGHAGIGIAGDMFDFRIIDHAISPLLGKGDSYRVMGKALPVPPEYYSGFARWHLLSLMRAPRTLRSIAEVARTADHPDRLHHLIALIEGGLGYPLYQAVSAAKTELSHADSTLLRFAYKGFTIAQPITRAAFESWIAPDLERLGATVDQALRDAGLAPAAVDRVFLTGGTAFVPAVRRLFTDRFGAAKLAGGGEFVSVAAGLALLGAG